MFYRRCGNALDLARVDLIHVTVYRRPEAARINTAKPSKLPQTIIGRITHEARPQKVILPWPCKNVRHKALDERP
jgi:hypothetical protein